MKTATYWSEAETEVTKIRDCFLPTVALVLAGAWGMSLGPDRKAYQRLQPRYVGSAVCFECHGEVAREWALLSHSSLLLDQKLPPERFGCEACHGPGGWHVTFRRKNIVSWSDLSTEQKNDLCLQCHQRVTRDDWSRSPHGQRKKGKVRSPACIDCHEVHLRVPYRSLLKNRTDRLCLSCHQEVLSLARKGLHHPIGNPLPRCGACHDAHHSPYEALLKEKPMTLCYRCHEGDQIKPKDHTPAFVKDHGKKYGESEETCRTCHGRTGCQDCHGIPMPHPKGFATRHSKDVLERPETCSRCHDQTFCNKCHSELPPESHDEADYPSRGHGQERQRRSLSYCLLCHQQTYCDDCHRSRGVPLSVR